MGMRPALRCWKSRISAFRCTASRSSTGSISRSRPARSRRSWGRMAPASRRSPMSSPASPDYEVTSGEIWFDGENLLDLQPDERARKGVFLAFQYPIEIPGVATMTFLKAALNAQRRSRGEGDLTTPEFMRRVREASQTLKIDQEMLRRPLNVGFSGGEKKRFEVLQMALLQPRLRRPRRDGFGARYRRVADRGRRRQFAARPGPRLSRYHALSAASRPHQTRCRARDGQRPHCGQRRARACPRARAERLPRFRRRGCVRRR